MNSKCDEKTLTKIANAIIGCISDDQLNHGALSIKRESGNDWEKVIIMNVKFTQCSAIAAPPIGTIKVAYMAMSNTYYITYDDNVVKRAMLIYYPATNKVGRTNDINVYPERFPQDWWTKVADRIELALTPVTPETPFDISDIFKQIVNHKEHWEPRTGKTSKVYDITLVARTEPQMYMYEIDPIKTTDEIFDLHTIQRPKTFYLKFESVSKCAEWAVQLISKDTGPHNIGRIYKDRDTGKIVYHFNYNRLLLDRIKHDIPDNTEAVLDEIVANIGFWCDIINSSKPITAAVAIVKNELDSGNIADAWELSYSLESVSNYTNTPIITAQQNNKCDGRILTRMIEVIKESIAPSQLNVDNKHLHIGGTYTSVNKSWKSFCLLDTDDDNPFPPYEFLVRYFKDSGKYKVVSKARECDEREYISYSTTDGFEMLSTDLWVYPFKEEWWNQLLEKLKIAFWTCRESEPNTVSEIAKQFLNLGNLVPSISRDIDISLVQEPRISDTNKVYHYRIIDITASKTYDKPSRFYLRFLHSKPSDLWLVTMHAPGQNILNSLPVCILTPHDNGTFDVKFDYHKQEIDPEKYPGVTKQVLDVLRDFIIATRDRACRIDEIWTQQAISKSEDKCDLKQDTSNTTAADIPSPSEILDVIDEEIGNETYLLGYSRNIYSSNINRIVLHISHRDVSDYTVIDITKRPWGDLSIEIIKPHTNSFYPVIIFHSRTNIEFDSRAYRYKLKDLDSKYRHFIKVLYGVLCRKYACKEVYSDCDGGLTMTPPEMSVDVMIEKSRLIITPVKIRSEEQIEKIKEACVKMEDKINENVGVTPIDTPELISRNKLRKLMLKTFVEKLLDACDNDNVLWTSGSLTHGFYWIIYNDKDAKSFTIDARLEKNPEPRWEISIGSVPGADIIVTAHDTTIVANRDHGEDMAATYHIAKLNEAINLTLFGQSLKTLSKKLFNDCGISNPIPYSATDEATRRREEFFGNNIPIMSFDPTDHNGMVLTREEIHRLVDAAAVSVRIKTNIVPKEVLFMPNIIIPKIKNVIFSGPVTTVLWEDNTKTQARAMDGVTMEPEVGLALCIAKKIYKSQNQYRKAVKAWFAASEKNNKKKTVKSDKKTKKTTSTAKKETKAKKTTSTEKKETKAKKVTIKPDNK